jgi:hypothetical protein
MQNVTHIVPNAFSKEELQPYIDKISTHYNNFVSKYPHADNSEIALNIKDRWDIRSIGIKGDEIITKVKDVLESSLRIKLHCHMAQIQIWPEEIPVQLHKHTGVTSGPTTWDDISLYNSMLYLNDDFYGGEFVTDEGIEIQPRTGTLTFFNGGEVRHGVNLFYGNPRYTIIFWWSTDSHWI